MALSSSRSVKSNEVHEFSGPVEFSSWVKTLKSRFSKHAQSSDIFRTIILLEGELGTGKTFFVQELVKLFGGDPASSPSFAIHNRYESTRGYIDHIDLYRLTDFDDLESTGFWDLFSAPSGLVLIEWGDRLALADLPFDWTVFKLKIETVGSAASGSLSERRRVSFTEYD